MSRLKNITSSPISLQMYKTANPKVNLVSVPVVLALQPAEDVLEATWLVTNISDPSYNKDLIDEYITSGILTRIG